MFERFTDRARRVLVLAQDDARLLGHGFIGTEHILLGLIAEADGIAAQALTSLGVELPATRQQVLAIIGTVDPPKESASPPFTPRSKTVLELSLREALMLGHNYIGTEHLLLALVREGKGVAAQVLVASGADLARVRAQVLQLLAGGADADERPGVVLPGPFGSVGTARLRSVNPGSAAPFEVNGPGCQHCGAPMATDARSRVLLVPDDGSGPPTETTVVYCGWCGRGIGAHVERSDTPPA